MYIQGKIYNSISGDRAEEIYVQLKIYNKKDLEGVTPEKYWMLAKRKMNVAQLDTKAMAALTTIIKEGDKIVKASPNCQVAEPMQIPSYSVQ